MLHLIDAVVRHAGKYVAAILGLCCAVIIWGAVLASLAVQKQQLTSAARQNTANLARAFEESTIRSIRAIEQALFYVRASYEHDPASFNLARWAQDSQFLTDLTFQVSLIGKDGIMLASSTDSTSRVDLNDREHFRVHLERNTDALFISKPVLGRVSGKWSIQFTRPMLAPDGAFDGVVVVSLDPDYLARFYNSVDLGADGVVLLAGFDGIIRARASARESVIGQTLAGGAMLSAHALAKAGHYTVASRVDGVWRTYAYREVQGYPLIVATGLAEHEVLATYYEAQRSHIAVATVLSLLLICVVVLIVRHQARLTRASEALQQSRERLALATESAGIGIWDWDIAANRLLWDTRMFELYGIREQDFDGAYSAWQAGLHPDDRSRADAAIIAAIAGASDFDTTFRVVWPNGEIHAIQAHALVRGKAADGRATRMVGVNWDITLSKQTEANLRAARGDAECSARIAEHSARGKAEFLAMMSHEIRSPMSGLLGVIELLRESPLAPEQSGMVELVHGSASSLLRIVNDILDFSKIEAGHLTLHQEPVDPRQLVAAIVGPTALAASGKGLLFTREVAADVPTWLLLDPLRLRQILVNLLGNAVKFTAAGTVSLAVTIADEPGGEATLCFAVGDSGIGMSPEQLHGLFEAFNQADASTTKLFGGTGLGLAISRRLARLFDGDITVASAAGRGSLFRLDLPLLRANPPTTKPGDATPAAAVSLAPMRILVAEDLETNRWLIEHQLARLGCSVTAVENGRAAFAALDTAAYDLLLTDCHMPEIDGIELTRLIRAAEAARGASRMLILGLTADVSTGMRARCRAAGMNDVVAKPIDLRRLHAALAALTDAGGAEPAAGDGPIATSVFDPANCRELFADDRADDQAGGRAEGREWLAGYLAAATGLVAGVERHIASGDRTELSANAHKLASASLAVGALCLGRLGRRLEAMAPEAPSPELAEMVGQVVAAWHDAQRAISDFIPTWETVA